MSDQTTPPTLVLGSTSRYRRELLERLGLPFEVRAPEVDETPQPGEEPILLATRLAHAKAFAVAAQAGDRDVIVIGSDQVADLGGHPLGKPGSHEGAQAQLRSMSGRTVAFHTAVTMVRPQTQEHWQALDTVKVHMRTLRDDEIDAYLRLEQPYDCAGSAKVEGLGITLIERIESDDPTALIGLPLISVTRLLRQAGLDVLRHARAQA